MKLSAASFFQRQDTETGKRKIEWRKVLLSGAVVLIFVLFFVFLYLQYSYAYPSHDDYGYASIHYHHHPEGATGMDFSMEQISEYLAQHYNTWGGRVLAFFQEILLFQGGLKTMQVFHTVVLFGIFLCLFFLATGREKTKHKWLLALACCSMFGLLGKEMSISGLYWYSASIAYMIPVLYLLLGAMLLWLLLFDKKERAFSVSKLLLMPFTSVLFFFAGFSMEQVGAFSVVTCASIVVLYAFRRRNPLRLLYATAPLGCAMWGYHIMLVAEGNNSRKGIYTDYYAKPFLQQVATSAETIMKTVFSRNGNPFSVFVFVGVIALAAWVMWKKRNVLAYVLGGLCTLLSLLLWAKADWPAMTALYWAYMVLVSVLVTYYLFSTGKEKDLLIWALYFGAIASQGACLVSPIFPARCALPFAFAWMLIMLRLLTDILVYPHRGALTVTAALTVPVLLFGWLCAGTIFAGFRKNAAVQEYNKQRLELTAEKYKMLGIEDETISLMRLPDDAYAGSTQPYGRELIKDWLKQYYGLPGKLEYEDFQYADYDAEQLAVLQESLKEEQAQVKDWIARVYKNNT